MKKSIKAFLQPVLLVSLSLTCISWGFLVHKSINQLAVYELPAEMAPFFHQHMAYLVKESVRADERRSTDSAEAPKHFIDFEAYDKDQLAAWRMPFQYEEAIRMYGRDSLEKYGYLPYHVIKLKERLTAAFRAWDRDSILFYAADLAHYIGDAHVPLHTTINYDGQLTGQKGLHSLWESMIPELHIDEFQLYTKYKVTYLKNPEQAIWDALRSSYILVDDMLKKEVMVAKDFPGETKYRTQIRNGKSYTSYTKEFADAYYQRIGKSVNLQMILSANLIADFWYTAWVDAGEPSLDIITDKDTDRRQLRVEKKAFKRNMLIKKGLLLSRQPEAKTSPAVN